MSYQYTPQPQLHSVQQQQQPIATFDLDDLLDLRPKSAAVAPPPGPPPPVNRDPYGFDGSGQTAFSQYSQIPPQTYLPPQQPPQPIQYPPQTQAYSNSPQQYAAAPQPYTALPQAQGANLAQPPYVVPAGPAYTALAQPQSTNLTQQSYVCPAGPAYTSLHSQQQPAQPLNNASQPYNTAPQTSMYSAPPQTSIPFPPSYQTNSNLPPQPYTETYNPPAPFGLPQMPPTPQTLSQPTTPASTQEDADRIQLEKIMRLRKELEREQERERQKREERETWPCQQCTFKNKVSVNVCEMCQLARPGFSTASTQQQPQQTPPAQPQVLQARVTSPQAPASIPVGSRWSCSVCGKVNEYALTNCADCNGYRSNGTPVAGSVAPLQQPTPTPEVDPTKQWTCNACTIVNPVSAAVCTMCASGQRPMHLQPPTNAVTLAPQQRAAPQPMTTTAWPCEVCTFENPINVAKCNMCGGSRPARFAQFAPPVTSAAQQSVAQQLMQQQMLLQQRQYPAGMGAAPGGVRPTAPPPPPPGGVPEEDDTIQWQADNAVTNCNKCNAAFSLVKRRHHCRACGFVFCYYCCGNKFPVKAGGPPEKVCIDCYREKISAPGR